MKILIAGCGIVGTALAARFSAEKHSVTVIDIKEKNLNDIQTSLDVLGVCGDASSPDILLEAGVSSVNLFIAVTDSDEENLLACLLARKLGAGNTIARVRSSQNAKTASILSKEMNLSMVINPEMDTAREIFNYLKYKDVVKVETLAKGTTEIITCTVKPGTPVCNIPVRDISKATGTRILICGLKRNNEVFIPDADTVIQAGDILSFAATTQNALQFLKKMKYPTDWVRDIVIVGGSKLGVFFARMVLQTGVPVKIIDDNEKRCRELINLVPEAEIICGDGTDTDVLEEEGVTESSVVVCATEDDSTNTMIALYLSREAPDTRIIIKAKKTDFEDMITSLDVGKVYNQKFITIQRIERYVRAMQDSIQDEFESMCRVIDDKVNILEFNVRETTPKLHVPLMDLGIKKNLLITTIYRNGKSFIPGGNDTLEAGDIVIIATTDEGINRLSDIFGA